MEHQIEAVGYRVEARATWGLAALSTPGEKLPEDCGKFGRVDFIQMLIHGQDHGIYVADVAPGTLYVVSGDKNLATISLQFPNQAIKHVALSIGGRCS